ncbi:MAG: ATP-binding protein [Thermoplasmata archaeon]
MYVERDIGDKFTKISEHYNMIAVVGARQAGKTTFLKHQMDPAVSSYVLFDDPDARGLFEEDIKKFEIQYVDGYDLSVLDEVHYCEGAGQKLKYLVDTGNDIWITSSSEIILAKDILSYLVGRVSVIKLYPFSYHEFIRAKGQKASTTKIRDRNIWEHIRYGGYPKVVLTDDKEMKKKILKDLYETMLLKDIARTFSIQDINSLELSAKYLTSISSSILTYNKMTNNIDISFQTLKKYLDAMEKSYLIKRVPPFYTNKRKELTKQPKIYFLDTGMRNIIANDFRVEAQGELFENYVFSELLKKGYDIKYWRSKSKAEVDFIVEQENGIIPIEVKSSWDVESISKSLRSFINTYEPTLALIVTYKGDKGGTEVDGCRIVTTDVVEMHEYLSGEIE